MRQGRQHDREKITALSELQTGHYGIMEPSDTVPQILENIDLILAPALSCDRKGYRLGYGGAYYDRFLSRTNAVCAALATRTQRMSAAPCRTRRSTAAVITLSPKERCCAPMNQDKRTLLPGLSLFVCFCLLTGMEKLITHFIAAVADGAR